MDYYLRYIKYKHKYLQIKQKGGDNKIDCYTELQDIIIPSDNYDIFKYIIKNIFGSSLDDTYITKFIEKNDNNIFIPTTLTNINIGIIDSNYNNFINSLICSIYYFISYYDKLNKDNLFYVNTNEKILIIDAENIAYDDEFIKYSKYIIKYTFSNHNPNHKFMSKYNKKSFEDRGFFITEILPYVINYIAYDYKYIYIVFQGNNNYNNIYKFRDYFNIIMCSIPCFSVINKNIYLCTTDYDFNIKKNEADDIFIIILYHFIKLLNNNVYIFSFDYFRWFRNIIGDRININHNNKIIPNTIYTRSFNEHLYIPKTHEIYI